MRGTGIVMYREMVIELRDVDKSSGNLCFCLGSRRQIEVRRKKTEKSGQKARSLKINTELLGQTREKNLQSREFED